MALSFGDYSNGDIPASAMSVVRNFVPIESGSNTDRGINSNLLMPEAARQLGAWQDAYKAKFGTNLNVSEAYRGIIRQRALYQLYQSGGTLAAVPGTSNHGFGRAVDFGYPVSSFGTAQHNWMVTTAASYGFQFDVASEAWHASYYGNPTIIASSTGTTTPIEEDDLPTPAEIWNTPQTTLSKNAPGLVLNDIFVHARAAAGDAKSAAADAATAATYQKTLIDMNNRQQTMRDTIVAQGKQLDDIQAALAKLAAKK